MNLPSSSTVRSAECSAHSPRRALLASLLLAACAPAPHVPQPGPASKATPPPAPGQGPADAPAPQPAQSSGVAPPAPVRPPRRVSLPPPAAVTSLAAAKRQFAQRLLAAHPDESYATKAQFLILAGPVYLVELKDDGHIRRIEVLRRPSVALDTVQLGLDAIRRAAPFGALRGVPGPWTFTETLLFDEQRRFKPRSLE